jgi:hypothetical protein
MTTSLLLSSFSDIQHSKNKNVTHGPDRTWAPNDDSFEESGYFIKELARQLEMCPLEHVQWYTAGKPQFRAKSANYIIKQSKNDRTE